MELAGYEVITDPAMMEQIIHDRVHNQCRFAINATIPMIPSTLPHHGDDGRATPDEDVVLSLVGPPEGPVLTFTGFFEGRLTRSRNLSALPTNFYRDFGARSESSTKTSRQELVGKAHTSLLLDICEIRNEVNFNRGYVSRFLQRGTF